MRFFLLVRCSPQDTSDNEKGDISLVLLSSAKVFNVAAQISQQVKKDGITKKHENTLNQMSFFLLFCVFLSSFLVGIFLLKILGFFKRSCYKTLYGKNCAKGDCLEMQEWKLYAL